MISEDELRYMVSKNRIARREFIEELKRSILPRKTKGKEMIILWEVN